MRQIWSEETKFGLWFEFQSHVCEALAEFGHIPAAQAEAVRNAATTPINLERIGEIEAQTRHESVAFLTWVGEIIGECDAKFLHSGLTSSDMLDTCFNVQLRNASNLIIAGLDTLAAALRRRAFEHRDTPCMGRSHGVHAEPVTFGLKMARAYAETRRNHMRMTRARDEISVGAVSGAVGTFAHLDPRIEEHVCRSFGLTAEPISSQIIPRDRMASYFTTLAITASSLERLAIEIRLLQQTEILEVSESFGAGQKGSSAMPHKQNPILSENVTGLARLVRAAAMPALENVALWHERDMSHSSVERAVGPDATATLDFALQRMAAIIDGLTIRSQNMQRNLESLGGLHSSQAIMLALVKTGMSRDQAYRLVQDHALRGWHGESFPASLKSDPEITCRLPESQIDGFLDPKAYLQNIDAIFERVFGDECS